jgi:carbon storage regulator CsrA
MASGKETVMLVLSRRENQKILFPNLGITVEILGLKGSNVRVGIDAPPEIRILRAELTDQSEKQLAKVDETPQARSDKHELNNRLNTISLQVNLAEKLMQRGDNEEARKYLQNALISLRQLDDEASSTSLRDRRQVLSAKPRWRALLVEDNANERDLLASILRMCGFAVDTASDGVAALEYLEHHDQPDCVLMDMQMPRLSGPETISMIREQLEFKDVPIYGVSGLKLHEANVALGERGVSGWFEKPVDADKMLRQIFADFDEANSNPSKSLN